MRGFVSMALCVELVESSGGVVRHERGRGWLKKSVRACGGLILTKLCVLQRGLFDRARALVFLISSLLIFSFLFC